MAEATKGAVAKKATIFDVISSESMKKQVALALPRGGVSADRLVRVVMTEMRATPKLAQCTPTSLMASLLASAQVGLEPGRTLGLAYLIPYEDRRAGTVEASFQLGYRGVLQLLWRSEMISSIQAEVVYAADHFDWSKGINPKLDHRPADGDRGEVTHVWAAIGTKSGGWLFEVWSAAAIEAHKAQYAKGTDREDSPWKTSWGAMAKKTLLLQAAKLAPVSAEAQRAFALDADGGASAAPIYVPDLGTESIEEQARKAAEGAGGNGSGEGEAREGAAGDENAAQEAAGAAGGSAGKGAGEKSASGRPGGAGSSKA